MYLLRMRESQMENLQKYKCQNINIKFGRGFKNFILAMNPIIGFVYVWYGKNTVKVALLHQEAGRQMGGGELRYI